MSELINTQDNRATIRWKLLTGASVLALTAHVASGSVAKAEDTDRPIIWIELGGQTEIDQGLNSPFTAPFMSAITPTPDVYSGGIFTRNQKPARFSLGENASIVFQPKESDWLFSASIRYGRSHTGQHEHQQGPSATVITNLYHNVQHLYAAPFADEKSQSGEHHAIIDFNVGKDVGLGKFGRDGISTLSAGVRFAQFSNKVDVTASGRPSVHVFPGYFGFHMPTFYNYTMTAHAARDFHGAGPSLSWKASAALAGNKSNGEITLDWGIDGALLFGRQKAKINHTTKAYQLPFTPYPNYVGYHYTRIYQRPHPHTRSRSVTVPNVGAFAGLSYRYADAKVSIGYCFDTFLNAMDMGIDAAKKANVTFNGPYASISIGLGD